MARLANKIKRPVSSLGVMYALFTSHARPNREKRSRRRRLIQWIRCSQTQREFLLRHRYVSLPSFGKVYPLFSREGRLEGTEGLLRCRQKSLARTIIRGRCVLPRESATRFRGSVRHTAGKRIEVFFRRYLRATLRRSPLRCSLPRDSLNCTRSPDFLY